MSAVGCINAAAGHNTKVMAERVHIMTTGTFLLILMIFILVGALPTWPHSRKWGYYPSGGLGLVVTILLILVLLGKL